MKKVKLGEVSEIYGGYAFKSKDFGVGENLVVKIKDIKPPIIDIENADKVDVTKYSIKKMEKYKIFPDDIVIAMTGATIGKVGRNKSGRILYLNQRVAKINPNIKEDLDFIYYSISNNVFLEYVLNNLDSNSAQGNISHFGIGNFEIHWYDRETRQKIAQILSCLDDKIEVLHQINDNLAELSKTIYDYWFVQFDFPDENGKPYKSNGGKMVYNEVLKREIPEGWEAEKLKKYAFIKKGTLITEKQANTNGNIKVVSAGLDFSYYHDKSNFLENTITISASGANAGFINFWREPIFACDCTTVRGNNLTETLYIYQFLKILQDYIYQQAKGSAQPHIYPKDIEDLNIIIPNENEIKKYGEYVNDLNQKILLNLKEIQHLQSLRDWLLPMLMNGQISVE